MIRRQLYPLYVYIHLQHLNVQNIIRYVYIRPADRHLYTYIYSDILLIELSSYLIILCSVLFYFYSLHSIINTANDFVFYCVSRVTNLNLLGSFNIMLLTSLANIPNQVRYVLPLVFYQFLDAVNYIYLWYHKINNTIKSNVYSKIMLCCEFNIVNIAS